MQGWPNVGHSACIPTAAVTQVTPVDLTPTDAPTRQEPRLQQPAATAIASNDELKSDLRDKCKINVSAYRRSSAATSSSGVTILCLRATPPGLMFNSPFKLKCLVRHAPCQKHMCTPPPVVYLVCCRLVTGYVYIT